VATIIIIKVPINSKLVFKFCSLLIEGNENYHMKEFSRHAFSIHPFKMEMYTK